MMIGRESLTEFIEKGEDNLGSGSLEFMKYKLWSQLEGSDLSPCYYGILEVEFLYIPPPFPCPIATERQGRIYQGQIVDYYPFFVSVATGGPARYGGVLLSPEYILSDWTTTPTMYVAYGIRPGQSANEALTGPNRVTVVNRTQLTDVITIYKVSPPIPLGPYAQPARISDCSGPSNPSVGQDVAFYGLGMDESGFSLDTTKVSCSQIEEPTCDGSDFPHFLCMLNNVCSLSQGGPIMVQGPDGYYLAGMIKKFNSPCTGFYFLIFSSLVFINIFFSFRYFYKCSTFHLPVLR